MNGMSDSSKLYVVEERVNGHEVRIERLETETSDMSKKMNSLSKLEAILEMQVEINRSQNLQLSESSKQSEKTFNAINQNLTQLNMTTEKLKEELDKTNQQSTEQLSELQERVDSSLEKRKIDTSDWGVRLFYWGIMAISTIILAWAMTTAGLS